MFPEKTITAKKYILACLNCGPGRTKIHSLETCSSLINLVLPLNLLGFRNTFSYLSWRNFIFSRITESLAAGTRQVIKME